MCSENFSSSSLGLSLGQCENTISRSIFVLTFSGVCVEHRSHEDIIGVSRESFWNSSDISRSSTRVSWSILNVGFFIRLIIGGIGIDLHVGSHWWSSVGSVSGNIAEVVIKNLLVSVREDTLELPYTSSVFGRDKSEEGG